MALWLVRATTTAATAMSSGRIGLEEPASQPARRDAVVPDVMTKPTIFRSKSGCDASAILAHESVAGHDASATRAGGNYSGIKQAQRRHCSRRQLRHGILGRALWLPPRRRQPPPWMTGC